MATAIMLFVFHLLFTVLVYLILFWQLSDYLREDLGYFGVDGVGMLIAPTYVLLISSIFAAIFGLECDGALVYADVAVQICSALIMVFAGWWNSIKKYREWDLRPDYTAFFVVCGFSLFAAAVSVSLLLAL